MAHLAGKAGNVYSTTTGTTVAIVAGIKSWTIDYTLDALDTTDFADSGKRTYIAGLSGWSGSFEGYKDGAPIAMGTVTVLDLRESATTTQKYTGACLITGQHAGAVVDGVVTRSYDFQGTGTLTVPTA